MGKTCACTCYPTQGKTQHLVGNKELQSADFCAWDVVVYQKLQLQDGLFISNALKIYTGKEGKHRA
jgi:hypothetical protein